jgi:hypothetical protein
MLCFGWNSGLGKGCIDNGSLEWDAKGADLLVVAWLVLFGWSI